MSVPVIHIEENVVKHKKENSSHNADLSAIFHRMASCYRYKGIEERFRALAYDKASRTLNNLKEDISVYATDVKSLDQLSGIGESIAEKIMEFLETGKIKTYEKLKKEVPQELLDLMDINGFGPATIKTLHEKLKIDNRDDLIAAIEAGKLEKLNGFGAKKIENMKRGLKLFKESHTRMLLSEAWRTGNDILDIVLKIPGIKKAELAGSLRRKKETIGDIDIIATAERKNWKKAVANFISIPQCGRVLASGETKASILLKKSNTQVDLRLVNDYEYGSALLYFTGSKEHNIELRLMAKEKGWKLNEYGLFDEKTEKRLAGNTEEEVYHHLGLQFIPPELRELRGEIKIAMKKKLPELIELQDMKGDMQMHSTWSDGAEEIETIAKYILKEFPQYEYIVMTDHSPSERIAGGLKPAEFRKQFVEIERVNKKIGRDLVKKGVEVDILADGSLDLPDDLLKEFDWVVASIHSGFNKDNTERLLKACEHPSVHCIGHPSGRLIGKREAYPVDWKKLFEKAVATGTAIEINAQPDRLDLKDDLVKDAIEKGVIITISTDSHALTQFDNMTLGVAVARRGWCAKENVLNTGTWKKVEQFKIKKKKG
ncbi:MAG TPA: DNA polymerase/3'-5' exonuclease PolX [Chitinophagaceae bacterium]|jgi:DNA polymerase (family 10)|nr:DNA polymerase/3'-5' exonuclease PolX [Chitinophagaceae bacterium]